MIIYYVVYNDSTGEIAGTGGVPTEADAMAQGQAYPGHTVMLSTTYDYTTQDHYVLDGVVTDRPVMGITVNGMVITGIPVGTKEYLAYGDDTVTTVNDGELDFTGSTPGTLFLHLEKWPYKNENFSIEVM